MMHSVNQHPAIKELGNFSFTCVSPRNLIQGGGKVGSSFLFKRLCVYLCCVIGISPFYPLLHNMFIISLISQALMHELNMQLKGCEEWLHVYDVLEFEGENERIFGPNLVISVWCVHPIYTSSHPRPV